MNIISRQKLVKCKPLTAALKSKYSAGCFIYLDPYKAVEMEKDGHVEIIYDEQKENGERVVVKTPQTLNPHEYYKKPDYDDKGKIKVAWVQDCEKLGGAELSNLQVLKIGVSCGFDVVCITPQHFRYTALKQADIIVMNNFYHFSPEHEKLILEYLRNTKRPYIIYSHDMRDLKCMDDWLPMYENSAYNVFISPGHKKRYGIANASITLPLAIDVEKYFPYDNVERKKNSVLIPTMTKQGKDLYDFMAKNHKYDYYAINTTHERISNVRGVRNDIIHKIYSKFEYVYHCPERFWAGDRVLFEAQLCGCKVIANDNVGHASWGFGDDLELIKRELEDAPFTFWETLERYVKGYSLS